MSLFSGLVILIAGASANAPLSRTIITTPVINVPGNFVGYFVNMNGDRDVDTSGGKFWVTVAPSSRGSSSEAGSFRSNYGGNGGSTLNIGGSSNNIGGANMRASYDSRPDSSPAYGTTSVSFGDSSSSHRGSSINTGGYGDSRTRIQSSSRNGSSTGNAGIIKIKFSSLSNSDSSGMYGSAGLNQPSSASTNFRDSGGNLGGSSINIGGPSSITSTRSGGGRAFPQTTYSTSGASGKTGYLSSATGQPSTLQKYQPSSFVRNVNSANPSPDWRNIAVSWDPNINSFTKVKILPQSVPPSPLNIVDAYRQGFSFSG